MSAKTQTSNELRDSPKMSLTARAISADARELVKQLHGQILANYATLPTRSYNGQAARGKLPRLIGAMVGEMLYCRTAKTSGWMMFNDRHLVAMGYSSRSATKLTDALQHEGLIERLKGYYPALGIAIPGPSRGRPTRIRASVKLIALCAKHSITPDNLAAHFKIQRTKKPRKTPGI
jgi:hypothetical protein